MPKPPPVEFFEVTVRCPKEMLGDLMADISKRGLTDVRFEHVTAVKTFAKNVTPEVSSDDFLATWIKDHPTFKAKEAVHAFRKDGRGNGSTAYHTLTKAVENGTLKKIGDGMYSRADVKQLPAPKKATKPVRREVDHRAFLLRSASRNHGRFNTAWMKAQFDKDKRIPGNVSPTIAALMKLKQIRRVGDGEYVLVSKAAAPKKTEPKANGAAAVEATGA